MIPKSRLMTAVAAAFSLHASTARAEEAGACTSVTRTNVVTCALRASLSSRAEREEIEAIDGRWTAASPILPSNPFVSLSGARRFSTPGVDQVTYNWTASLSQEVEIAGQRGARRRVVGAERDAQGQVVLAADRDTAAAAWNAYFEALAAREDLTVVVRLEALGKRMVDATTAATGQGLLPGVDVDLADATFLRIAQSRIASDQRRRRAATALATLLGLGPTADIQVEGDLAPLPQAASITVGSLEPTVERLPQVRALRAGRRSFELRADYYRRARVPNLTVSLFSENDELNLPVLGVGLGFPLVLPLPFGRTYAGEIQESEATARKLGTQTEQTRRAAREDIAAALQAYEAARAARDLYTAERLARADQTLQSLVDEIAAGRLAVRDAVVTQQALMDLLRASIEAKRALCAASVAVARVAGVPLERGGAT